MTRSYRHLTFEERCQVKNPKKSGLSKGSIAQIPIPIELGTPLPLQRGHQNAIFRRENQSLRTRKQLVAFCGLCWQRHIVR